MLYYIKQNRAQEIICTFLEMKKNENINKKINDLIDEVGVFEIMNQLLLRKEIIIFHYFAPEDLAELWGTTKDIIQIYSLEIQNKINKYMDGDEFGFTDTILEDFKKDFELDKGIDFKKINNII